MERSLWIVAGLMAIVMLILVCKRVLLYYHELQEDYRMVVRETSARCLALEKLNAEYTFRKVEETTFFTARLDTKAKFDRFQLYEFFLDSIAQEQARVEQNRIGAETNLRLYSDYMTRVKLLPGSSEKSVARAESVPFAKYNRYEEERFRELLQKPVCHYRVICIKRYSSPQGRNQYKSDKVYTVTDIEQGYREISRRQQEKCERERSVEYQRSLVTPKVRYMVLQRDHFRCVLCGRGASAAELEVDHIKPVSRGGTSDMTNLRTLCRDCNRGKGASWQEGGNN